MKWNKRRLRVERYGALLARLEDKIDERLHRWADWLQLKSDQLPLRWKTILFIMFCIGVSCVCAMIIVNALK